MTHEKRPTRVGIRIRSADESRSDNPSRALNDRPLHHLSKSKSEGKETHLYSHGQCTRRAPGRPAAGLLACRTPHSRVRGGTPELGAVRPPTLRRTQGKPQFFADSGRKRPSRACMYRSYIGRKPPSAQNLRTAYSVVYMVIR